MKTQLMTIIVANGRFPVYEPDALRHSLEDISVLIKTEENLSLIMKNGKIYKNTIK